MQLTAPNIPKEALIHSIKLKHYIKDNETDGYSNDFFEINNVLLHPDAKRYNDVTGRMVVNKFLMFVCARGGTTPFDLNDYQVGAIIQYDNKQYKIEWVDQLPDGAGLHHLEVYLT